MVAHRGGRRIDWQAMPVITFLDQCRKIIPCQSQPHVPAWSSTLLPETLVIHLETLILLVSSLGLWTERAASWGIRLSFSAKLMRTYTIRNAN